MIERFAVYFAPAEDSLLWHRASVWLGRDATSGEMLPQAVPEGFTAPRFADLTESARRYGFHGTLRSPFRLASNCSRETLETAIAGFAKTTAPLALGPAEVRNLSGFLAIMPVEQSPDLTAFAANCVAALETCRAPLTDTERARRLPERLSARQVELLDQYGYPYVMEEYRFHMTLTDRLDEGDRAAILPAAQAYFAEALAAPLTIDRVVLFYEPEPGMPFFRLTEVPLTGSADNRGPS